MSFAYMVKCQGWYGPCTNSGLTRRQNTAYHEDHLNWVRLCDQCMEACDEHWDEMWQEHYRDRL